MNRTDDKGQPCRSPTCTGNKSDLLPAMRAKLLLRSYRDRAALSNRACTHTPRAPPTGRQEGHSRMPSSNPQNTWIGWANSHAPWKGYRAGPVFHDWDENCPVFTESAEFSSPVPWHRLSRGGWGVWFSPVVGTHPPVTLLIKRDYTPVCQARGTVPDCHTMMQSRVNQDRPTTSRHLRYSGRISSTCGALPPGSFLTTSVTSAWVMDESTSEPSASASSMEDMSVGLRRSSKYSFHRPTISPVEVSSFPPPLKTVLVRHRFPLLRCCMVCQNFFDANQ